MDLHRVIDAGFSGVISVRQAGTRVFEGAYGCADIANKVPNTLATKFATASAGKVFVATAVLGLIETGRLGFDSRLGDIVRFDLRQIDPDITVRQLLNHTSGIPDYFDETVMQDYEALWRDFPNYRIRSSADLIPLFIDKPMMYPRGKKFQYNNTGYVVLGLILEELAGLPFDVYLRQTIFDPCGMDDTGYYELDRLPAGCALSYIFDADGRWRTNIYSVDAKGSGAGGAFTTAGDVETFWDALLGGRLIGPALVRQMTAPQVKEGRYGYGLWLLDGGIPSFQGCDPGVNFMTSYDPEKKRSVTILSNVDYDAQTLHGKILAEINA